MCSGQWTWRDVAARRNIRLDIPIKSFIHRQWISIRKQLPSLRPVSPWCLLNVMKSTRARLALLFVCTAVVHSPSRVSYGFRKRIDNARGHVGYTKIVYLLGKAGELVQVSISDIYGRLCHCCSALESNRRKRETFSMSASTREFCDSCTLNINLSRVFFTLFSQGDYSVHAWGDPRDPPRDPRFSSFSLSAQKESRRAPFGSKSSQMCSKIRRAYQIGKH